MRTVSGAALSAHRRCIPEAQTNPATLAATTGKTEQLAKLLGQLQSTLCASYFRPRFVAQKCNITLAFGLAQTAKASAWLPSGTAPRRGILDLVAFVSGIIGQQFVQESYVALDRLLGQREWVT